MLGASSGHLIIIFWHQLGQGLQVDDLKLAEIGPKFEHHQMFPSRTNTGYFFAFLLYMLLLIMYIMHLVNTY